MYRTTARSVAVLAIAAGVSLGTATGAFATEGPSYKECALGGSADVTYDPANRTFTGVFTLPEGCEDKGYVIYVNPLDRSTTPQGELLANRQSQVYTAGNKSVTTDPIPLDKFEDCKIDVQADARVGKAPEHGDSERVRNTSAFLGFIRLPQEQCNPTPSPTPSTPTDTPTKTPTPSMTTPVPTETPSAHPTGPIPKGFDTGQGEATFVNKTLDATLENLPLIGTGFLLLATAGGTILVRSQRQRS